jgi:hypothetical protein
MEGFFGKTVKRTGIPVLAIAVIGLIFVSVLKIFAAVKAQPSHRNLQELS